MRVEKHGIFRVPGPPFDWRDVVVCIVSALAITALAFLLMWALESEPERVAKVLQKRVTACTELGVPQKDCARMVAERHYGPE